MFYSLECGCKGKSDVTKGHEDHEQMIHLILAQTGGKKGKIREAAYGPLQDHFAG